MRDNNAKYVIGFIALLFIVAYILLQIAAYMTVLQTMCVVFFVFYVANKLVWALFGTAVAKRVLR